MNHPLIKWIVLYGGGSVLFGLASGFLAAALGIPMWAYLVFMAVALGSVLYVVNQAEEKQREAVAAAIREQALREARAELGIREKS